MQKENQIEVLNDLIRINNDRIEGYRKATEQIQGEHENLIPVFSKLQAESQSNIQDLKTEVLRLGGSPDDSTTTGGKIYRAWMDVKATFGGDNPKSILASCEGGEDAAKRAYSNAVESGDLGDSRPVVMKQKDTQMLSHNEIKMLRDQYKS